MNQRRNDRRQRKDLTDSVVTMPRGEYIRTKIRGQHAAKQAIAVHIAMEYVRDFDAVLLDAGSTAELVAEEMFANRRFLSVLTNNMGAYASYTRARAAAGAERGPPAEDDSEAHSLLRGNELLITGGRYVDTYEALLGDGTINSIKPFTPNITIIGISGLRWGEGVFCHGAEEAAVKNLLWTKPTDTRLIATDWTKIGRRDAHTFGKADQLGVNAKQAVVVTCNPPDEIDENQRREFEEQINAMRKASISVVRLDVPA
jgi:DeoR/GlpR family transcriptional regulator of sugar metabolism